MTVFRGNMFSLIRHRNALKKTPQNCLKMTQFSKIIFFAGANFRELCKKPRNRRKLIPAKIDTNKVAKISLKNLCPFRSSLEKA